MRKASAIGHLSFRRKWCIYLASAGVWLTGIVWLLYHYFFRTTDSYGFARALPGEHYALVAHAAFGFAAIWFFGVLWPVHVKGSWRVRIRRGTGGTLFAFTLWLTLTGFLLYYLGSDFWRHADSLAHWIVGIAGVAPFAVHLLTRAPRNESAAAS